MRRRTPLVASGFLAGALLGALPPVQSLTARVTCAADGGEWLAHVRACEYRDGASRRDGGPAGARRELPLPGGQSLDEEPR